MTFALTGFSMQKIIIFKGLYIKGIIPEDLLWNPLKKKVHKKVTVKPITVSRKSLQV